MCSASNKPERAWLAKLLIALANGSITTEAPTLKNRIKTKLASHAVSGKCQNSYYRNLHSDIFILVNILVLTKLNNSTFLTLKFGLRREPWETSKLSFKFIYYLQY